MPEPELSKCNGHVQQRYAMENPRKFEGYGEHCWGITASQGPGPATLKLVGVERLTTPLIFRVTHQRRIFW